MSSYGAAGRFGEGRSGIMAISKLISVRLGATVALLVATVIAVSLAALIYLHSAEEAARGIKRHDAVAAGAAADIAVLLERHRRLVETALLDRDPSALDQRRQSAERIGMLITTLLSNNHDTSVSLLRDDFDALTASARAAFFAAREKEQSEVQRHKTQYTALANRLQETVRSSRNTSLRSATETLILLERRGEDLRFLILATALPALLLLGPISLLIVAGIIRRINQLTYGMRRVALNDTTIALPALDDGDEIGDMARALEVFRNNAETLVRNAKEIERLNAWFDIALNNMARGLSMFDAHGRLVVCNRQYLELYQLTPALGQPGTHIVDIAMSRAARSHPDAVVACEAETRAEMVAWFDTLRQRLALGTPFSQQQILPDGRTIDIHVQPLDDGGWVDLHEDITEADRAKRRITELASSDTLTGLANRRQFMGALEAWYHGSDDSRPMAVLWFDLDRFKAVNDTYGHPVGDTLLRLVAKRLRATVRGDDLIARLGGDEFAILLEPMGEPVAAAEIVGRRVIAALSQPFDIDGRQITVGASVGVAIARVHGATADDLLQNADIALYRAKTSGRGTVVAYQTEFEQTIKAQRQLESDLRLAVEKGELMLHYQPIVDLQTGQVVSCEALMRWRHRDQGMISPAVFIPMAEDLGLIEHLGAWALKQACLDAATWPRGTKVAVNVSASQFASRDLVSAALAALATSGLEPERLEVEVTELVLLRDDASTLDTLNTLSALGISIALDDFGTGYASLSYLRRFPFNKIKIDQSFIRDMKNGSGSATIVRAIVNLANTLGMTTVAEGIETLSERDAARHAGCHAAQGYYYSRPVPPDAVAAAIADCSNRYDAAA